MILLPAGLLKLATWLAALAIGLIIVRLYADTLLLACLGIMASRFWPSGRGVPRPPERQPRKRRGQGHSTSRRLGSHRSSRSDKSRRGPGWKAGLAPPIKSALCVASAGLSRSPGTRRTESR